MRSLLERARAFLAAAKVGVSYTSLQIAVMYLVVEQARAAQQASSGNTLLTPSKDETQEEKLLLEQMIAAADNEKQSVQAVDAQTESPLNPAEAAELLRALIEEELRTSGQARGLGAEQVVAQDEQGTPLPQVSIQNAEPVMSEGSVQIGWPSTEQPAIKGYAEFSPFGLLGGVLLGGLGGGGGGGPVATAVAGVKAALYSLGIVADGYISGSTVKLYGMVNGVEQVIATATTNALGQYQFDTELLARATKLVASGGTDVSTGLKFNGELTAPASSTVVNPLTTLIQSFIEQNPGLTTEQAMQTVKTALGIPAEVNLLTYDPIAQASSSTGDALVQALAIQSKAAQVANVLIAGSQAVAGVKGVSSQEAYADILTKMVEVIKSHGSFDLTSTTVLDNLLSTGGAQSVTSNVISLLATGNGLVSAGNLAAIYEYQKIIQGDLAKAASTGAIDNSITALANLFDVVSSGQKVISISLAPGSDTGFSDSDSFTNVTSPEIRVDLSSVSGVVAVGNSVKVMFGAVEAFSGILTAANLQRGYIQFSVKELGEGVKSLSVVVHDNVKNVDIASGFLSIYIDKSAPVAGTLTTPIAGDNFITKSEADIGVTLTGHAELGSLVKLTVGGKEYAAKLNGDTWSLTLSKADITNIGNGPDKNVIVTVTDKAGNATVSEPYPLGIDITNDEPTGSVIISGTPAQGQTLTASDSLIDLDGLGEVSYQWQADGVNINGATGSTLVLGQTQVGKTITVKASYIDGQGSAESVTSSASAAVANVNDAPAGSATAALAAGTEDTAYTVTAANLLAGFTDVDGNTLS
ncbi:MAG: cadherin-like domain-containing protein, partial [Polaromonas sp.]|nr:cadherin-like domain-containing protein [Polaromonas sp.]